MDDDWGYPYDLGNLPLGVNIDIYILIWVEFMIWEVIYYINYI